MRISDWSSDVCSSDLKDRSVVVPETGGPGGQDFLEALLGDADPVAWPGRSHEDLLPHGLRGVEELEQGLVTVDAQRHEPLTGGIQPADDDAGAGRLGVANGEALDGGRTVCPLVHRHGGYAVELALQLRARVGPPRHRTGRVDPDGILAQRAAVGTEI